MAVTHTIEQILNAVKNAALTALHIQALGRNETLDLFELTWAAEAAQDTEATALLDLPAALPGQGLYRVAIRNPSANTALKLYLDDVETLGTGEAQVEDTGQLVPGPGADAITVAAGSSIRLVVQGWGGEKLRVRATNSSALAAGQGFTALGKVRML